MAGSFDLSTTYLGLRLAHPFMSGASPLADQVDTARRLEDAGCAALVLHSLFEEQITQAASGRIRHMDPLDRRFAPAVSRFPPSERYGLGPHEYLEHIRRIKAAVKIPVIGSLNGTAPEAWLKFAHRIEEAGADALELNAYEVVTDPDRSAIVVERGLRQVVEDLKQALKIPVAVKLSPFFTAFGNVARELDRAGADGLVLFNRFIQPDIDIEHVAVWPHLELSCSSDLLLRLRWLAILFGRVRCALAATGGVATASDGVKAILAGAHAVQMVSTILRNGPSYFSVMRDGLRQWMESHGFERIDDVRGRLSLAHADDPSAFERGQYLQTLSNWAPLLAYQVYSRSETADPRT